jgi:hypothetical protein
MTPPQRLAGRSDGYDRAMTSIENPRDRAPAEGGDLPEAGPGAERAEEHPLSDEPPEEPGEEPVAD